MRKDWQSVGREDPKEEKKRRDVRLSHRASIYTLLTALKAEQLNDTPSDRKHFFKRDPNVREKTEIHEIRRIKPPSPSRGN